MTHQMSLKTGVFVTFFFCYPKHKWEYLEYSATSHGKGIVDGIDGTAKSRVYAEVKAAGLEISGR